MLNSIIFYTWAGNQYQNIKISKYQNIKTENIFQEANSPSWKDTENIFQEANSPSWKDQTFNEPKSSFD